MSVEQRLETVETDLELVKQLLASTASYGESAQRRLDQQTTNQERLDSRLNEFIFQAQRLIGNQGEKTTRLEGAYERLEAIAAHLTRKQDTHDQTLQTLTQIAVDQATLLQRQDEQINELSRIASNYDAQLEELRRLSSNHDAQLNELRRLSSNHDAQLNELRRLSSNHDAQLNELRAGVARLDRLMDYVIRREQGGNNPE